MIFTFLPKPFRLDHSPTTHSRILVMLTLTLQPQAHLPKVTLPSRLPQLFDLLLVQLPPNDILQLLLANLLQSLLFLRYLIPRLKPRLHAYPKGSFKPNGLGITSHIRTACLRIIRCNERIATSLERECRRIVWNGDNGEGFRGRYGGRGRGEDAVFVGAKVPYHISTTSNRAQICIYSLPMMPLQTK